MATSAAEGPSMSIDATSILGGARLDDRSADSSDTSFQSHGQSPQDRSSSATPPSSLTTRHGYMPTRRHFAFENVPHDALEIFSNLDNYLAVGCLTLENLLSVNDDNLLGAWREVQNTPEIIPSESSLQNPLQALLKYGWVRMFESRCAQAPQLHVFRVYVLSFDIGRRVVDRGDRKLCVALEYLIRELDVSRSTWKGKCVPGQLTPFDEWATSEHDSLFWIFNNLPSPDPNPNLVKEKYAREALEDLLDPTSSVPGLRTTLYPYQRRSAGLMLQRESVTSLELDPRLEQREAPDGSVYYFGAKDFVFLRQPRYYETCKGGIVAETMGLGKTLICLALILATKDHLPKIEGAHKVHAIRPTVGRLSEMAVSAVHRLSIPWKVEFARIQFVTGIDMASCRAKLESSAPTYMIQQEPTRWNRTTVLPPPLNITLAATTLVVVPRNLLKQWQSEITKHVDQDALRVLVMEDTKTPLPALDEIRAYDIILFTRNRFELEIKDGADEQGRRLGATARVCQCFYIGATRTRNCNCLKSDNLYDSPLKYIHFKRLIIDEGHFFSNTSGAAVSVANKLIRADHRWVVSGTPAKDLLGVEVDATNSENFWHTPDTKESRDRILEQRRHFSKKEDVNGAAKSLGALAAIFLKIRPWSIDDPTGQRAVWDDYVYRHEDSKVRTFSGFSTCLRRTLESMVVKTRPDDIERDINLPPLSHNVVRLEPSFYDKLTANMFTVVLTANAITSEYTDMDYIWHKNSVKARHQLIANLRQSAFCWTGFSEADVKASIESSTKYLAKDGINCTQNDRERLLRALSFAQTVLDSPGWCMMSRLHEVGLFVDHWPSESAEHWAFDESRKPLLTGLSQLIEAQKHVNSRALADDPGEGLSGAGIKATAVAKVQTALNRPSKSKKPQPDKPIMVKTGIPTSSLDGEPILRRRNSLQAKDEKASPKKLRKESKPMKPGPREAKTSMKTAGHRGNAETMTRSLNSIVGKLALEKQDSAFTDAELSPGSPYSKSHIVGTSSAKMSYLITQIMKYHHKEKILVFYDGDNAAYYIAQMLELLHIKHEIYAKSLASNLKAKYVVKFNEEEEDRVLLMDVKQAAFGLNLSSASRVYFVNPVCRPNIEAQAIKRAHRIGQTRKVYVETLVLQDTIEEKMLERAKRMTRSEHLDAGHLEDDGGIKDIIQCAELLPVVRHKTSTRDQMAALGTPQRLWGRAGWAEFLSPRRHSSTASPKKRRADVDALTDDHLEPPGDQSAAGMEPKRPKVAFVDLLRQEEGAGSSSRVPHLGLSSSTFTEERFKRHVDFSAPATSSALPFNRSCSIFGHADPNTFGSLQQQNWVVGAEAAKGAESSKASLIQKILRNL